MKNRIDSDHGVLEQYLDDLADDLTQADTSIKTGNVMADAVLNSKLSVAEQKGIRLNVKAHIPNGVTLTDAELCSILGNLFDNAMENRAILVENLVERNRISIIYSSTVKC